MKSLSSGNLTTPLSRIYLSNAPDKQLSSLLTLVYDFNNFSSAHTLVIRLTDVNFMLFSFRGSEQKQISAYGLPVR